MTSIAAVAVLSLAASGGAAGASTAHRAAVVVDTGDRVVTVWVSFHEETISGAQLLRRADVDARFASYGGSGEAVCSILGVGSPTNDCFAESRRSGRYWNYSVADGDSWQRSPVGVSQRVVRHGDIDGWRWGGSGATPSEEALASARAQQAEHDEPQGDEPGHDASEQGGTEPADSGPTASPAEPLVSAAPSPADQRPRSAYPAADGESAATATRSPAPRIQPDRVRPASSAPSPLARDATPSPRSSAADAAAAVGQGGTGALTGAAGWAAIVVAIATLAWRRRHTGDR